MKPQMQTYSQRVWVVTLLLTCSQFVWISRGENVMEAWVQRYTSLGNATDGAARTACDRDGNVVVVGATDRGISGRDLLVVKYSSGGVPLWTNLYVGPGNKDDAAAAVAIGSTGDVVVTGGTDGVNKFDFITIKYSSAGVPLWTNYFNGTLNVNDYAGAVALDSAENVYVAGGAYSTSVFNADFVVIKYSSSGIPLWTNQYRRGLAYQLAVDDMDNVIASGNELLTIKYATDGTRLWTNTYGNSSALAYGLATDTARNSITSGGSATIKFSEAGVPLWTNVFSSQGMAADSGGNAIVFGRTLPSVDFLIKKFSPTGATLWTRLFPGPNAQSVAVDGNDNVFVAGYADNGPNEFLTVKYASDGSVLWENRYPGSLGNGIGVTVEGSGNAIVTGNTAGDIVTIKYSGAGAPLWTNRFSGARNADDNLNVAAVDPSGNVIVAGAANGQSVAINYSLAGTPLWTNAVSGAARAVAVAGNGDVTIGGDLFFAVKYDSTGNPLWTNRFLRPGSDGRGQGIAGLRFDHQGAVVVTGHSQDDGGWNDFVTIKYSDLGVPLWTNLYHGPGNSEDAATALAVDGAGNVIVTGPSRHGQGESTTDFTTIKYSSLGLPLWTNRYNGPVDGTDYAFATVVNTDGDVFVTGQSAGNASGSDIATVKYSGAGVPLWTNRYDSAAHSDDTARNMALDRAGNVVVAGSSTGVGSGSDFVTIKYSGAGVPLWTNRYNGPANGVDQAKGVAINAIGEVFVTGNSIGVGGNSDCLTIKYSPSGEVIWTQRYNGPANGGDTPTRVVLGPGGAVMVVGYSDGDFSPANANDAVTIKYLDIFTPIVVSGPTIDNGDFVVRFAATAGLTYTIENSGSLSSPSWQKATNITAPAVDLGMGVGVFEFKEARGSSPSKYYRVVYPAY